MGGRERKVLLKSKKEGELDSIEENGKNNKTWKGRERGKKGEKR